MKYKVTIHNDGTWGCDVVNKERHACAEIVNVIGSFGQVVNVKDKQDDVPVTDTVHIGGQNV
jgi:hypothetical protein